jgi:enoyl-CoA hydratase
MDADYSKFQTLDVRLDERLLRVVLNRPDSLNAVDSIMHEELEELWTIVRFDDSVGCVLLTGSGRSFCVGADFKSLEPRARAESQARRVGLPLLSAKQLISNMLDVEQPIVAAVQGHAIGVGATIALCSDVVIATDDAVFADTHVALGLVAGDGGCVVWPSLLPMSAAKYYLLTGDGLKGDEAARLGLVLRSVPADELHGAAEETATRLAKGASLAIRWTKYSVNKILRERLNLLIDTSLVLEGATLLSEDHAEAILAFSERRSPRFSGR